MKKLYEWAIIFFLIFVLFAFLFIKFKIVDNSDKTEENSELYKNEQYYKIEYEKILNENSELKEKLKEETSKYNEVVNSSSYKRALYAEELEVIVFEYEQKISKYKKEIEQLEKIELGIKEQIESAKEEPISFYAGEYICGKDFLEGRYLIYDGDSNFCVYDYNGRLDVNIILGDDPDWGDVEEYLHFFEYGEIIQSDSPFKLKLVE